MDVTYLLIEMILAAIFAALTVVLSQRFLQAGIKHWGWILTGLVLIIAGAALKSAFSVQSFTRLFVPTVSTYANAGSQILRLGGLLIILLTFYFTALRLHKSRMQDRQRENDLKLLDNMQDTINRPLSLIELLNFSIRELAEGTSSAAGCIFIYNPNRQELVLAAHRGLPKILEKRLDRVNEPGSILIRAQKSGQPHLVGNISHADRVSAHILADSGFKSLLAVPLPGRNESLGVAVLFSMEAYYYSREQTHLISSAAGLLGPAVASFRLEREFRELSRKYKSVAGYERFTRELFEISFKADDPQYSLQSIFELASSRLGVSFTEIYAMDNDGARCVFPRDHRTQLSGNVIRYIRDAILKRKSLLVKAEIEDQIGRSLVIPFKGDYKTGHAAVLHFDSSRTNFAPAELEQIRLLAGMIEMHFRMYSQKPVEAISQRLEGIYMDDLNDLNNVLTGILGNAQLLGISLNKIEFDNKPEILSSLDKIADEAYQAGQMIMKLEKRAQGRPAQSEIGTTLESVINSISSSDKSGAESKLVVNDYPSIRFEFVPGKSRLVDISEDEAHDILASIFTWLERTWKPQSDLIIRLFDVKDRVYFSISDYRMPEDIGVSVDSYDFRSFAVFPDPAIARLYGNKRVDFYYDKRAGGHLLVLRFPGVDKKAPEKAVDIAKPKILAIDDQEMIRELLASMLEELKYPHQIFADGESGVQAFEQDDFDLVITDLGLPGMDGWEVARRIKSFKPSTPVIVISGWGLEVARQKAPDNLADFFLTKPFRMEQLGELLKGAETSQADTGDIAGNRG